MSSSEQQPADESKIQANEEPLEVGEQEEQVAVQPFYEFPPAAAQPPLDKNPQAAPLTQVMPEEELQDNEKAQPGQPGQQEQQPLPSHEAIQKGLVYPPPPSYYQNMPAPGERPSLPTQPGNRPPIAYASSQPSSQSRVPGTPLYPPPGPPAAPYPQGVPVSPYGYGHPGQPPVKKSYRWVWILVSVLGVTLLVACGLLGWGVYSLFNSVYQQVSGSLTVVDDFYSNLQAENYSAAYSDLAPRGQIIGLTQAQFTSQASKLDGQYGPITSFVLGQPSFSTSSNSQPDLTRFTVTVDIKRTRLSYTVLLTVNKINGTWKIIEYDRL
jgi:hypothetical protein